MNDKPIRRTLSLIVRGDGTVRVMYTTSRGDEVTGRESWGLAQSDEDMRDILAGHPVVAVLDFVLPRIQSGRSRISLLRDSPVDVEPSLVMENRSTGFPLRDFCLN